MKLYMIVLESEYDNLDDVDEFSALSDPEELEDLLDSLNENHCRPIKMQDGWVIYSGENKVDFDDNNVVSIGSDFRGRCSIITRWVSPIDVWDDDGHPWIISFINNNWIAHQ